MYKRESVDREGDTHLSNQLDVGMAERTLRYVKWFWCSIPLVLHKYDKSRSTTTNENNQQNVTLFITGGKFNWQQTRADPKHRFAYFVSDT